MDWFKFYGKDWLTDIKVVRICVEDRLCFITLLCLANNDDLPGIIKNCNEESIIEITHLYENPYDSDNEVSRARGFLKRLHDNGMITLHDNGDVTVTNFNKRQQKQLSGYERVKKYREKHKISLQGKDMITNDNVNDNAMITLDKIREDKIYTASANAEVHSSLKKKL